MFRGSDDKDTGGGAVLLHGRRQAVDDIYRCAERVGMSSLLYAMPVADQSTWYPRGFMRPIEDNEPRFSDALAAVHGAVLAPMDRGFSRDRITLMRFSQGACLACEYVYRNPDQWGGLIAFTGGLFGSEDTIWRASGSFRGTPVFLGIGDPDEWIPAARVHETADAFRAAGAEVQKRTYPGIGHRVCDEEIAEAREILEALLGVKGGKTPKESATTGSGATR